MSASPQRRIAIVLLLAAIAQPAWGVVHAALHAHIAAHHGETPATSHALVLPGAQDELLASSERPHDHEHPIVVYLRPTQGNDLPSAHALTVATPALRVVAMRRWSMRREAEASRTGLEESGPSDPRAPPIA